MADHQNSGGFIDFSNAGLIPLQHAWVYGEKTPWCLNGNSVIDNNSFYTCIILDAVTLVFSSGSNIYTILTITRGLHTV